MQEVVKVRINQKMIDEWSERGLTDNGFPKKSGIHEFSRKEAESYIRFMKQDLSNYLWEGGWQEYGDLIAATKRQIANFQKALNS